MPDTQSLSQPRIERSDLHPFFTPIPNQEQENGRPIAMTIPDFVRRAAERFPDRIAVSDAHGHLTYRELETRSTQLANILCQKGVGPESLVGIYMERTIRTVVAILGVVKAGGCYVPIELAYPPERVQFILEDSNARVVLTESHLAEKTGIAPERRITFDADWQLLEGASDHPIHVALRPDNAAYVIYTSGSTGKPKGVIVTHENVVRLFTATEHWYGFNEHDVWTVFHSFGFDFSVWEIWGALFYGGRTVVVDYSISRSPEQFYQLLVREGVTVLNQTPSAFRQLIWAEEQAASQQELKLRYVIFGGEALELQSLRPWFERHGDQQPRLVNMYGITETTVHVTYRPITIKDVEQGLGSVIGVAIPDLGLTLVDEHFKPVPVGIPGEICVGGKGVARGYLNRPELTAQKFIPDPQRPGQRLYRSGDLGKYHPNGELEYLGRIDHQVKVRGFRIELGEIESVLNSHAGIRESVVTCEPKNGKRLVGYIVAKNGVLPTEELRKHLQKKLPDYMVPSRFVFLEAMPLTVNGKADRKALPAIETKRPQLRTEFAAPRNDDEAVLAEIWEQVLEIEGVGINDNFFELGGDSIRSIQVLARAQERGIYFSLQKLFQKPTIAELAAHLESAAEDQVSANKQPFALISAADRAKIPAGVEDAYPMAKLQHGMVFHSDYDTDSAIFHDVFSFRFRMPYDQSILKQAVARLVARHSIYRTSLHVENFSEPLQLVHKEVECPFTTQDLRGQTPEEQRKELVSWVEKEKRVRFDWTVAPLMRLHTQRYEEDCFQLIVSFHHAIMDGWSLAAMLTELFQDYSNLLAGKDEEISAPRVSYRDFVELEQQAVKSETVRSYWAQKLKDPVIHSLPRWPETPRRGGHEQVRGPEIIMPRAVLDGLKKLAHDTGIPIRTVLLAAHCRVLGEVTGQKDILTGLVANGRPQCLDGERLIGLFLNTIPFRVSLEQPSWQELVRQTFQSEQELIPHRRAPLSEIQQIAGGKALFETTFDFVQFHVYRDLPGYKERSFLEDHYFEANNFNFFVTFMLNADATELQMHFDYNPNEFCEEQISLLCDYYVQTLKTMASSPEAPLPQSSVLPEEEQAKLLNYWNQTDAAIDQRHVYQIFEEHALSNPSKVAVRFGQTELTYGDLNNAANLLATELSAAAATVESLVGIFCERSIEMLVSMLAVHKAGAGYLPLDPSYPAERVRFMLSDSETKLVLTTTALEKQLHGAAVKAIRLDELLARARREEVPNPARASTGENLAYVIYTSGSTGTPKGVEIPQQALTNFICAMQREPGIASSDRVLAITTLSFDIAVLELLLPLTVGATVVIAERTTVQDPSILAKLLAQEQITLMQATPSTWISLKENGWKGSRSLKALSGGEPLTRELADFLTAHCREVWNMYGPTETTVWSSCARIQPGSEITIGRPVANTTFYILDENLRLVPTGSQGELYIGGAGLARGYRNRPQLTAERFVHNPFREGEKFYKTGDLAHYLADGRVACLGRTDHQVKLRGYRIELGEIEAVLQVHPSVARAVVAARDIENTGQGLVAYWVPRNGNSPSHGELRDLVQNRLPSYMVPSAFVQLSEIPLTPNGKVDRNRLPAPTLERAAAKSDIVLPRTPLEKEVAAAWMQVLGVRQVGIHDNFFELGGHSLLAMKVLAILRNRFNSQISIATIFKHPTVESFSLELMEHLLRTQTQEQKKAVSAAAELKA